MNDARQHLSPVWTHLTDMVVDRAEGAYLYDTDGHRWLDFTCGIGVTNTGHCHPKVVEAIREQAGKILHAQANIYYHQPMLQLAERLRAIMPDRLDTYFFSNSGAEAIEASIKLARHATGRTNVIVFQGSFHGRTVGTMSLTTSKTVYRTRYQPLMAGVFVAPFPYSYYYGWDDETTTAFCLREIERLLKSQTAPEETAAMLIEPVLGEGGYVVPPVAFEQFGILPDIVVMAKGIASGLPLSGIAASRDLMDKWEPGTHGGTYGGNALACAAWA